MENNLVTLAIHTYDRAIILKGILESQGIDVALHNVNLVQPVVSAGVRVRIKASDLPAALHIMETVTFGEDSERVGDVAPPRLILVPVDFSEFTLQAAKFAFSAAKSLKSSIVFLHTYYTPYYVGGFPIGDTLLYDAPSNDVYKATIQKCELKMQNLSSQLRKEIDEGRLPDIAFKTKLREGVPEEQIIQYAKKHKPLIIIIGTQGANAKHVDMLGSVTAEIIDRSNTPVFAFPQNTPFNQFDEIRTIGFITRFDQRDLVVFDSMTKLLKDYRYKVYFIHFTNEQNAWSEIQLAGIKEYLGKQYPELETSYALIEGGNIVKELNEFIKDKNIDVLTLASNKRNVFARLFNPSIANRMIFHGNTPLLVLKS